MWTPVWRLLSPIIPGHGNFPFQTNETMYLLSLVSVRPFSAVVLLSCTWDGFCQEEMPAFLEGFSDGTPPVRQAMHSPRACTGVNTLGRYQAMAPAPLRAPPSFLWHLLWGWELLSTQQRILNVLERLTLDSRRQLEGDLWLSLENRRQDSRPDLACCQALGEQII